ncbi:MAG: MFS transporter [Eubacteriales bacterium]|nr:MFS transporter [Eubacteriales bacterium]
MSIANLFERPVLKTRIKTASVSPKEMLLGYFIGPFAAFISNAIFTAYLNRYYSDVLGWTDTARFGIFSALLPIISVAFVIVGNLIVGRLIDNTRTVQGKARPFLALSAPMVTLTIALLFLTPTEASPMFQMIWIALSYNLYYAVAYPFFYTSHSSMVALSTRDSSKRGMLATLSNASGVAAVGFGASILIPFLLQHYLFVDHNGVIDTAASYRNWRVVMVALCIITFIAIWTEYYFTRERITEENQKLDIKEEKVPLAGQVKACIREPYWWVMILYFLLFQLGGLIKNGSMGYYARWMFDGINSEAAGGAAMGMLGAIGGIPTSIGMLIAWPIASRFGKKRSVQVGLLLSVLGGLVSFIDVHQLPIVGAGIVLKGIGSIPAMFVTLALLSDVLDHLEAKNGFRSDGFTMAVYGSIMVGMTGLGNGIINALLTASGYDPLAAVQNAAVQQMLAFCFLGAELICYAVLVGLMCFLHVEKYVKQDQQTILERQKAAVLAAGGEWIEPAKRLQMEQEENERLAREEKAKK